MRNIFRYFALIVFLAVGITVLIIGNKYDLLPKKTYDNEHFGIENFTSKNDKDGDNIDDQTDILQSAIAYINTKPKYKSVYYGTGYPDDEYGVCTDVVAFALLDSGYDLMLEVNEHILSNRELYPEIETPDKNIDFRRVRNLKIYFENTAEILTNDINDIDQWQGGDIVIFPGHIGIISDKRNKKGVPYLIHHGSPNQIKYEEDVLSGMEVIGHYRVI